MQTLLKASTEEPRVQERKDDESTSGTAEVKRGNAGVKFGWDAYEVWRTRVAAYQTPVRHKR
jgi:hypothetical protein